MSQLLPPGPRAHLLGLLDAGDTQAGWHRGGRGTGTRGGIPNRSGGVLLGGATLGGPVLVGASHSGWQVLIWGITLRGRVLVGVGGITVRAAGAYPGHHLQGGRCSSGHQPQGGRCSSGHHPCVPGVPGRAASVPWCRAACLAPLSVRVDLSCQGMPTGGLSLL